MIAHRYTGCSTTGLASDIVVAHAGAKQYGRRKPSAPAERITFRACMVTVVPLAIWESRWDPGDKTWVGDRYTHAKFYSDGSAGFVEQYDAVLPASFR